MKSCFLSMLLLLAGITIMAQQPAHSPVLPKFHKTEPVLPSMKDGFKTAQPDTSDLPLQKKLLKLRAAKAVLAQATFSHKTARGNIYLLPGDQMPCLVADMKQVTPMPGNYNPAPPNNMPNAIPPRSLIIPKNGKKKEK